MINFQSQQIIQTNKHVSLDTIKRIIHNQMIKKFIACRSIKANEVFYYTPLHFRGQKIIQIEWLFKIQENSIQIKAAYSTIRTLGFISKITEQRAITQISLILKSININTPKQITVTLSKQGIIFWKSGLQFQNIQNIHFKKLFSLQASLQMAINYHYSLLSPFISINSNLVNNKNNTIKKEKFQKQQVLSQLKIKIKSFENFRQSRKKSTKFKENNFELLVYQDYFNKINLMIGNQYLKLKQTYNYSNTFQQGQQKSELQRIVLDKEKEDIEDKTQINQNQLENKLIHNNILTGIRIIDKNQKQKKLPNSSGAHSFITSQKIKFSIVISIASSIQKQQEYLSFYSQIQNPLKKNSTESIEGLKNMIIPINLQKQFIQQRILAKKIPKNDEISRNSFKNQVSLLTFIRNSQCSSLSNYHLQANSKKDSLLMPFYEKSLSDLIRSQKEEKIFISFFKKLVIFKKIVKGVQFLSKKWILHRDLKPSNIMLNQKLQAKIIDFGSCSSVYNHKLFTIVQKRLLGTPGYHYQYNNCNQMLKSIYNNWQYDEHLYFDSYSLGKLIKDLFFHEKDPIFLLQKVTPQIVIEALIFIKERCLDQNPDDRLSSQQILQIIKLILNYFILQDQQKILNPQDIINF